MARVTPGNDFKRLWNIHGTLYICGSRRYTVEWILRCREKVKKIARERRKQRTQTHSRECCKTTGWGLWNAKLTTSFETGESVYLETGARHFGVSINQSTFLCSLQWLSEERVGGFKARVPRQSRPALDWMLYLCFCSCFTVWFWGFQLRPILHKNISKARE